MLSSNSSKVSITIANRPLFLGITCHFIDNQWKLRSLVLDIKPISNHNGQHLAKLVYDILMFYKIENRIQCIITTDKTLKMLHFLEHLEVLLGPNFDSKEQHVLSFEHVLNLVAQHFMEVLNVSDDTILTSEEEAESDHEDNEQECADKTDDSPVNSITFLVKKIKKSNQLQSKFKISCDVVGIKPKNPIIIGRNSTFEILNWAVKYKPVLDIICDTNKDLHHFKIEEEKWKLIESIVKYLKPFKTLSSILSGEKCCSLPMTALGINILLDKLKKWIHLEQNEQIALAINTAIDIIAKHYENNKCIYCICLILDPRQKKETLQVPSEKFEEIFKCQYYKHDEIKKELEDFIDPNEYNIDFHQILIQNEPATFVESHSDSDAENNNWRSEVSEYYNCNPSNEDTDILSWWHSHTNLLPNLSKMARDFLSITPSSVSSKILFSRATSLLENKLKNRLRSDWVRMLVCLNSWSNVFEK